MFNERIIKIARNLHLNKLRANFTFFIALKLKKVLDNQGIFKGRYSKKTVTANSRDNDLLRGRKFFENSVQK